MLNNNWTSHLRAWPIRSITCRMGSHNVTFHPVQGNTPRRTP